MPTVDLTEIVPEDLVFKYGNPIQDYVVPGDLDTDSVLRLYSMFSALVEPPADGDKERDDEELQRLAERIDADLLAIFKLRQPEMTELPFGTIGKRTILREILVQLGVLKDVDDTDPPKPSRKKPAGRSRSSRSPRK